jgi:hypothetical protein
LLCAHPVAGQDACRRSEKLRTRLSICTRKRRYRSRDDALAAIAPSEPMLRIYRCDRCFQFHLTSRTKGKWVPKSMR